MIATLQGSPWGIIISVTQPEMGWNTMAYSMGWVGCVPETVSVKYIYYTLAQCHVQASIPYEYSCGGRNKNMTSSPRNPRKKEKQFELTQKFTDH